MRPTARAPLLSVFGGKITTYRRLAEHALEDLRKFYPRMAGAWTGGKALADGELADAPTFEQAFDRFAAGAAQPSPGCRPISCGCWRAAMAPASTSCWKASAPWPISAAHFGGHLYEHEVRYLMREEWAVEPDDVLWRRSKEGLHMTAGQRESFAQWMQSLRPNA